MNRSLFFFLERISGKEMLRKAVWAVVGNQKNKVFGQVVARLEQHNKKVFQVDPRDSSGALPTNLSQVLLRLRSLRIVFSLSLFGGGCSFPSLRPLSLAACTVLAAF